MKGTVYLYEVSHPDYPTVTVPSIGPDSATVEAARRWGVPELWGRLAGYCTVRRGGRAARPRCTRCGREFGTAGPGGGQVSGLSALGGAAQAADGQYPRF